MQTFISTKGNNLRMGDTSQVPRPNLRCGSGERTPQELGKKLWSHKTQKISMVIIKSWCLLENCVRGEATDVGVTHSSSSVARQEAVLGHLPFATWVTSHLQLHFTAAITCISLGFLRYLLGISFHITAPSISSEKRLSKQVKWVVHSNSWVIVPSFLWKESGLCPRFTF